MNYRHHYHAGNFADAMKHVFLVALVRALQCKPKGILFGDTHAGGGEYDLAAAAAGRTLPREPEHPGGIGQLVRSGSPAGADSNGTPVQRAAAAVQDYLDLVRAFSPDGTRYPGSPRLLQLLARPQDRLVFCELHPEEFADLDIRLGRTPHATVQPVDGYSHLRAVLPPAGRRSLVLIDPPYETGDEWTRVQAALEEGLRRLATGTFVLWHPVTARAGAERYWEDLAAVAGPPTWAGQLLVRPGAEGFRGSGLIVVNPPYAFARYADELLGELARRLCPSGSKGGSSRWLRPDR